MLRRGLQPAAQHVAEALRGERRLARGACARDQRAVRHLRRRHARVLHQLKQLHHLLDVPAVAKLAQQLVALAHARPRLA
eukprot:3176689-Prymnesium_polylepis.1